MPNALKTKSKPFEKRAAWLLILINTKREKRFTSLKDLRNFADTHRLGLKKSRTQEKCYLTSDDKE